MDLNVADIEDDADNALAYAIWVVDGNIGEAPNKHAYIERAKKMREWLRVNNHDVKCINCDIVHDHW